MIANQNHSSEFLAGDFHLQFHLDASSLNIKKRLAEALMSQSRRTSDSENEQRGWIRHPCTRETSCHVFPPHDADFWAERIENISAAGITIYLDRIIPVGTVVPVELHHKARGFSCHRRMRVVYFFQQTGAEHVLGGAFEQNLAESEIKELL